MRMNIPDTRNAGSPGGSGSDSPLTARLQLGDETALLNCSLVAEMESRGQWAGA